MNYLKTKFAYYGLSLSFLFALWWIAGCVEKDESSLNRIYQAGKVTVITANNAHCYYIYREDPMGFEYELAAVFAKYLAVDLNMLTPGWSEMFDMLKSSKGDFIAASLTKTPAREKSLDFSDEYLSVRQYVIIHKDNYTIRRIGDLNGKIIHVRSATSYEQRLLELKKNGLEVNLILHKNVPTEELIRQVAKKEIEITIADTNVAFLNRRYFPNIKMIFPITEKQSLGWAVRKGNTELLEKINKFFVKISKDATLDRIYEKYYSGVKIFDYVDLKKFHKRVEIRLPQYKNILKQAASKYGFDWLLIAAVTYQESHFNPNAKSHTGVRGMMQLTLKTAQEMGIKNRIDPVQSIQGGVKYLSKLYNRFEDIKGFDRILFTLAAYNVGYGHVRDAQEIAHQLGLDRRKWFSLKQSLPLLRYPKYHRQTAHGYARGTEPVRYVDRILTYYDILRRRFSRITLETHDEPLSY
jgi:membrane-bound lytic murein transglycosylase F